MEHKQVSPHLELRAVTKKFKEVAVVEDLSLDICLGRFSYSWGLAVAASPQHFNL